MQAVTFCLTVQYAPIRCRIAGLWSWVAPTDHHRRSAGSLPPLRKPIILRVFLPPAGRSTHAARGGPIIAPNNRPDGAAISRLPGNICANRVPLTVSGREQITTPTGTGRIDSGAAIDTFTLPPSDVPIEAAVSPAVSTGMGGNDCVQMVKLASHLRTIGTNGGFCDR